MARRLAAMFGVVLIIALALTLLYRVYVHHTNAEPYVDDGEATVVQLDWTFDWTGSRADA